MFYEMFVGKLHDILPPVKKVMNFRYLKGSQPCCQYHIRSSFSMVNLVYEERIYRKEEDRVDELNESIMQVL